jgi:hypothetical protein
MEDLMSDMRTITQTMEISPEESEVIKVLLIEDNLGDTPLVKEMLLEGGQIGLA